MGCDCMLCHCCVSLHMVRSSRACLQRWHNTGKLGCRRGGAPGAQHKRADELRSKAIIGRHTDVQPAVTRPAVAAQLRHLAAGV